MLGTLLVRSFERAERLYQAMLSRGYSGDFPVYGSRRFSWRDLVFIAALVPFVFIAFRA
jgi:cobalt/nickel transport system permease protein